MTTHRNFAKHTILGHTYHKTSTLHRHPKRLKPTESSLFDILPTVIHTYIKIWISGLKHRDKFKAVILHINFMYKPVPSAIP